MVFWYMKTKQHPLGGPRKELGMFFWGFYKRLGNFLVLGFLGLVLGVQPMVVLVHETNNTLWGVLGKSLGCFLGVFIRG